MPNYDGTGPQGEGPRTGRQKGNCKNTVPKKGIGGDRGLGIRRSRRRVSEEEE